MNTFAVRGVAYIPGPKEVVGDTGGLIGEWDFTRARYIRSPSMDCNDYQAYVAVDRRRTGATCLASLRNTLGACSGAGVIVGH
jgi:hypothetical protein